MNVAMRWFTCFSMLGRCSMRIKQLFYARVLNLSVSSRFPVLADKDDYSILLRSSVPAGSGPRWACRWAPFLWTPVPMLLLGPAISVDTSREWAQVGWWVWPVQQWREWAWLVELLHLAWNLWPKKYMCCFSWVGDIAFPLPMNTTHFPLKKHITPPPLSVTCIITLPPLPHCCIHCPSPFPPSMNIIVYTASFSSRPPTQYIQWDLAS